MAKYVKKPIVVDADPYKEGMEHGFDYDKKLEERKPYFNTRQGKVYAKEGDMIITQQDGEKYPCDLENFNLTYEIVDTHRVNPGTNFMRRE
jgi:hypothetical protein